MSGQEGFPDNVLLFVRKGSYELVEPPREIGRAAGSPDKTPEEDTVARVIEIFDGMGDQFTAARIARDCRELTAQGHVPEDVAEYALYCLLDIDEGAYRTYKGVRDAARIVEASRLASH